MNELIEGSRTTGTILLDGQDVSGRHVDLVALRRRVGMVFQKSNPFPKSVFDNVAYGPRVAGLTDPARLEAVVDSSLRKAGLWNEVKDRLDDSALNLSGGQQQRVCIARALATDPEVILHVQVQGLAAPTDVSVRLNDEQLTDGSMSEDWLEYAIPPTIVEHG